MSPDEVLEALLHGLDPDDQQRMLDLIEQSRKRKKKGRRRPPVI